MFVYYEKFPATVTLTVTQIVMSCDGCSNSINWKNPREKAMIDMLRSLFKQVPLSERTMDDSTYIWTFIGFRGDVIIEGIKSMINQGLLNNIEIKEIEDLEEKTRSGSLDRIKSSKPGEKKFKDEDFFHKNITTTQEVSGAKLLERLAPLLEIGVVDLTNESDNLKLKKLYRKAALRLHPDRNNGDGSKMSELNMLWNIFMQQV